MADELTLDSQLSFAKNGVAVTGGPYHASVDVAGDNFVQDTVVIDASGDTTLDFGDIVTPGYVFLRAVRAVPAPDAPVNMEISNIGTAGATTYTYKFTTIGLGGIESAASDAITTATGNATLTGGNYNQVTWPAVEGATSYKAYRTVGGATQGLIATLSNYADTIALLDVGLTGGGETPPSAASITGDIDVEYAIIDNQDDQDVLQLRATEFAIFRLNGSAINITTAVFPMLLQYAVFED